MNALQYNFGSSNKEEILKALYDSSDDLFRVAQLQQQIQIFENEKEVYSIYLDVGLFILKEINIYTKNKTGFTARLLEFGLQLFNDVIHTINNYVFEDGRFSSYQEQLRRIAGDAIHHSAFNYHEKLHHAFEDM